MTNLGPYLGDDYTATLRHVLALKPTGYALEFGVAEGGTLALIAKHMPAIGFDSFAGLPEDWRGGFNAGKFACPPPNVNAELVVGLFADTLPDWRPPGPIGLVHIDCDLASSTATVLQHVGPYLQAGCLIVFDEWHGYDGCEQHEQRAWHEYAARTGATWEAVGHGPEQVRLAVVIPWRDSGDLERRANYDHVHDYYLNLDIGPVIVADDGHTSGPFNRSAAYNRGMAQVEAAAYLWNEADTILPADQITTAVALAHDAPGIVIPYTERHELDQEQTYRVLNEGMNPFMFYVRGNAAVYSNGSSIGQAGVTSRHTLDLIGGRWDEGFAGWGYDDDAMFHIYRTLAGPPRWVEGKGVHLYHQPGFLAPTPREQAAATAANAQRFHDLRALSPDELRARMDCKV